MGNGYEILESPCTVDINNDAVPPEYKENALTWNLTAAEGYKSEQKIEQDIHVDHYKFNRKAKIKDLPRNYVITHCSQIEELFPSAFKKPVPDANVYETGSAWYIWQYSFSGKMFHNIVKYKFALTLYYYQLDAALDYSRVPLPISEFSIRVYSPGEGYGPWQYEALKYSADIYQQILQIENQDGNTSSLIKFCC